MSRLSVAYFATPEFSLPTLEELFKNENIDLKAVVSMPDRPKGRGHRLTSPPVIDFARENNIPYFQTPNINKDVDTMASLEKMNLDLIVVLAFAQFLSNDVLNLPRLGCFNIHTSLLPKYRGAAPIQYALLNHDPVTGVSIQKMVLRMDAGDIVKATEVEIEGGDRLEQLSQKLSRQAPLTLRELIIDILNDRVQYQPQDESLVSFAPTIKKEDGLIHFTEDSFMLVLGKLKAYSPWPGVFCYLNGKRLKIHSVERGEHQLSPGQTSTATGHIEVGLLDGTVRLVEIQLEGKRKMFDYELLSGLREKIELSSRTSA